MLSDVQFHRSTCVRRKFQLGRLRINFLVSFQQNCSIWTRAEVAVSSLLLIHLLNYPEIRQNPVLAGRV